MRNLRWRIYGKEQSKTRPRVDIARNFKTTPMAEKNSSLWIWRLNIIRPAGKGRTKNGKRRLDEPISKGDLPELQDNRESVKYQYSALEIDPMRRTKGLGNSNRRY